MPKLVLDPSCLSWHHRPIYQSLGLRWFLLGPRLPFQLWGLAMAFPVWGRPMGLETGPAPRSHAVCSLARRGVP